MLSSNSMAGDERAISSRMIRKEIPMANRSRTLPRLAVAALPIVSLLWGCQSGAPKAFRYTGPPAPPGLVEIRSDCTVKPDKVVVEVGLLTSGQALWHAPDKQAGD